MRMTLPLRYPLSRMVAMLLLLLLLLLSTTSRKIVAFTIPVSSTRISNVARTYVIPIQSSMDALMDFNSNFKKGLKFVLVPQSRTLDGQIELNSYDSTKNILSSTVASSDITTASQLSMPEMSHSITETTPFVIATIAQQQVIHEEPALSTMQSILTDRSTIHIAATTYPTDPVVGKTLMELEQALTTAPPAFSEFSLPIPQGNGLAVPILDKLVQILEQLQQQQQELLRNTNWYDASIDPPVTIVFGFEVRSGVVNNVNKFGSITQQLSIEIKRTVSTILEQIIAPTITSTMDTVRETIYQNQEMIQTKWIEIYSLVKNNIRETTEQIQQQLAANRGTTTISLLPTEKFIAVQENLQKLLTTPDWMTTQEADHLWEVLNIRELGGWYLGVVAGVFVLVSYQYRESKDITESTVSSIKSASSSSSSSSSSSDPEKDRLENMVMELTQAVNALSVELQELQTEQSSFNSVDDRINTQKVLAQLEESQKQNTMLQSQLDIAKYEVSALLEVNEALATTINELGSNSSNQLPQAKNDSTNNQVSTIPTPPTTPPPLDIGKSKSFPNQAVYFFANDQQRRE